MSERDRIAEILQTWCVEHPDRTRRDPEELLKAHPDLVDELRDRLEALDLLDQVFSDPNEAPGGPPSEVGPYRILREIGRGGMGVVYEADQTSMKRRVALKVLAPSITGAARSIKRFKQEAHAAGKLHHTNIVPIHDMGQHGGYWYYAMELVEGRSVSQILDDLRSGGDRVRSSQLRMVESSASGNTRRNGSGNGQGSTNGRHWYRNIASTFAGVAEALQLVHDEGIVHRDVKPSNLLLDVDGTLKLVDFGLAHLEGNGPSMTRTGDLLGTPAYMSPEQASAKGVQVDHRTDIYSLGATLYEILTLRAPFDGGNLQQLCSQIVGTDPAPPRVVDKKIPRELETIVLKAMEKDRSRRYQHAGDLAADLRRFAEGESIAARRTGPLGRTWRSIKRHKALSSLVVGIVLTTVGGSYFVVRAANASAQIRNRDYEDLVAQGEALLAKPESSAIGIDYLSRAITLAPKRYEAYLFRSFATGRRTEEERLDDVDSAADWGLSASAAVLFRQYARMHRNINLDQGVALEVVTDRLVATEPLEYYVKAHLLFARRRRGDRDAAMALLDQSIDTAASDSLANRLARYRRADERTRDHPQGAIGDLESLRSLGD